ncbi:MAG: hypothetical protein IJF71_01180 [Clostridia bacterium]|nr:hypothetical protein [Clostridia bacterium]
MAGACAMLSIREKELLSLLNEQCGARHACLILEEELLRLVRKRMSVDGRGVERMLLALQSDGYLDVVRSYRSQTPYYCLTLLAKGVGYRREIENIRRQILFKVLLTVATALLGILITKGLLALF